MKTKQSKRLSPCRRTSFPPMEEVSVWSRNRLWRKKLRLVISYRLLVTSSMNKSGEKKSGSEKGRKKKYVKCIFHPPGVTKGTDLLPEPPSVVCVVCLGEVPTEPKERARTRCGHTYCKTCIVMWLSQSPKDVCPTCRGYSVPLKDGNGEEILYDKIPTPPPEVIDPPEFLQQQLLQGAMRFGVRGLPEDLAGFNLLMQLLAIIPPPPPRRIVLPPEGPRVRRRRR